MVAELVAYVAGGRWIVYHVGEGLATRPSAYLARCVRTRWGVQVVVNIKDRPSRHVYFHGTLNQTIEAVFYEHVTTGGTVLDVGANTGLYTCLSGKLVGSAGRVHAFEPDYESYELLTSSVLANGFEDRTILRHEAVSDESGRSVQLYTSDGPDGKGLASIIQEHNWGKFDRTMEAFTLSLDDYVNQNRIDAIDLVKIDVEGSEVPVLRGFVRSLARQLPRALLVEVTEDGAAPPQQAVELITSCGYSAEILDGDRSVRGGDLGYGNILFRRAAPVGS